MSEQELQALECLIMALRELGPTSYTEASILSHAMVHAGPLGLEEVDIRIVLHNRLCELLLLPHKVDHGYEA